MSKSLSSFLHYAYNPNHSDLGLREAMEMGIRNLRVLIDGDWDPLPSLQDNARNFYTILDRLARDLGLNRQDFDIALGLPATLGAPGVIIFDKEGVKKALLALHEGGHQYRQIVVGTQLRWWKQQDKGRSHPIFEVCSDLAKGGVIDSFGLRISDWDSLSGDELLQYNPVFTEIVDYLTECSDEEWRPYLSFLEIPFNPAELWAAVKFAPYALQEGVTFLDATAKMKLSVRTFRPLKGVVRAHVAMHFNGDPSLAGIEPQPIGAQVMQEMQAAIDQAIELEDTLGGCLQHCRNFPGYLEADQDLASAALQYMIRDTENELNEFSERNENQEAFVSAYRKAREAFTHAFILRLRQQSQFYAEQIAGVLDEAIPFLGDISIQQKILSFYQALPYFDGAYLSISDRAPLKSCLPLHKVEPVEAMAALQELIAHAGWDQAPASDPMRRRRRGDNPATVRED